MTTLTRTLRDTAARQTALTDRRHGLLVEAGAGSGKTAILAGRVALLIADGVSPGSIAAITFTELAAAELASRVREYVDDLGEGRVPTTLALAFPAGAPGADQRRALAAARDTLDELTCTTIHGFARELARPYPVEADIDPGARVMDATEQGLLFDDVFTAWLRERLGERAGTTPAGEGPAATRPGAAGQGSGAAEVDVVAQLLTLENGPSLEDLTALARLAQQHEGSEAGAPSTSLGASLGEAGRRARTAAERFLALVAATPGAATAFDARLEQLRALAPTLGAAGDGPGAALTLLTGARPHPLFTKAGALGAPRVKKKWTDAAGAAGMKHGEAVARHDEAAEAFTEFGAALARLHEAASDALLHALLEALREVGRRYRDRKRAAALLDFDDLIGTALELLRRHADVRAELAARYLHVLIDEFQDTDPQQAEIVWRLTGEPDGDDWRAWPTRPGARFVVGDPKQSIYRFRGADATTYGLLSAGLAADPGARTLELSTNFRSLPGILEAANETFALPLGAPGQPGYRPLDAWHGLNGHASVQRLQVPAPNGAGAKTKADEHREAEAESIARLVGDLVDGTSGLLGGPVSPGDIALLAPVGSGLEIYERALDARGLAVASQAGKGFYRRQEVQDLVALTRALADPRDRLALGAVLRGPLVGATDEELLDATELLAEREGEGRYLDILTPAELLPEGPLRRALARLQPLALARFATTPHTLLARALDALEVRALLEHRHGAHADRSLANLDRFLEHSRAYDVRGLTAFAHDVWAAWEESESELEGRADSERDAVTLITIHSAKGLEWRVVIPVNTASEPRPVSGPLFDRASKRIVAKLLGQECSGYAAAKEREEAELQAERIRLWYVAATRARELLVIPHHEAPTGANAWCGMVEWLPAGAPLIEPNGAPGRRRAGPAPADVAQSRERFLAERAAIEGALASVTRRAPSRRDDATLEALAGGAPAESDAPTRATLTRETTHAILAALDEEDLEPDYLPSTLSVGAARGILLHKLLEEVINGECEPDTQALSARAATLAEQLHLEAEERLDPAEVAACALRAWGLPEVTALHGRLLAEVEVAGVEDDPDDPGGTILWGGIADAIAVDAAGRAEVIVDWKSDRHPSEETLEHYRQQLRAYLRLTGARQGLIVLATRGEIVRLTGSAPEPLAAPGAASGGA